jgi:hypothetical protein
MPMTPRPWLPVAVHAIAMPSPIAMRTDHAPMVAVGIGSTTGSGRGSPAGSSTGTGRSTTSLFQVLRRTTVAIVRYAGR